MSKQLYEEALADVKRVKEVAEDNAKRAILDAVTPRLKELIERELLRESSDDDDLDESVPAGPGAPPGLGDRADEPAAVDVVDATAVVAPIDPAGATVAVSSPDADGKVCLDIDALCGEPAVGAPVPPPQFGEPVPAAEEEFEVSMESVDALSKISKAKKPQGTVNIQMAALAETVRSLSVAKPSDKRSAQIVEAISRVEDMYDHVQASVTDPAQKASVEAKLEAYFKNLNELREPSMSKENKKVQQLDEADVTLKLTGLPDDIDLDSVGVDLVTGEEEEGGEGGLPGGEGGDELDLGGGDDMGAPAQDDTQMESLRLSDDTIVEIDENMLRREIARMKSLREETEPASWGHGVGSKEMDDFGGGKDGGEAFTDVDIEEVPKVSQPLGEADGDDDDDDDDLDEADAVAMDEFRAKPVGRHSRGYGEERAGGTGLDELELGMEEAVDGPDHGGDETMPTNKQSRHPGESGSVARESLQRRAQVEAKIQQRAKSRAASLKKEAKTTRDARKLAEIKRAYSEVAKRFNESLARSKKVSKLLKLQNEAAANGASTRQAGSKAEEQLRAKLAETNLFNQKLLYTNKLLQNESLTAKQKSQIIRRLDAAKTSREVKLVYESLSETLAGQRSQIKEGADRQVVGSASAATRPASTQTLNEGVEAARWARLAGITK